MLMKTSIRRLLAALLPAMAIGAAPAYADSDAGFSYRHLGGDQLAVAQRSGTPYAGHLTIPAHVEIDGKTYTVTAVDKGAFQKCTGLLSVELPSTLKSIGQFAFEGCTALTSVSMPSGVRDLGSYTFMDCTSLTDIEVPDSITAIGPYTFNGCTSLRAVSLPAAVRTIGRDAFSGCTALA